MAKDEGRQLVPHEMLEGQQNLEGFGGFAGAGVNEDPAVADTVKDDRRKLFTALIIAGPAVLAIPKKGNADSLIEGTGDTVCDRPDFQTAQTGQAPDMCVQLPGVDNMYKVGATNDDRIVAVAAATGEYPKAFVIGEDGTGALAVQSIVQLEGGGGAFEITDDDRVIIGGGGQLEEFELSDPEGSLQVIMDTPGQASFTSAESFTDGEGKVNVLALGQTPGVTNSDSLHLIDEDGLVTTYDLPALDGEDNPLYANATFLELSDSQLVVSSGAWAKAVPFDKTDPAGLEEALDYSTPLIDYSLGMSSVEFAGHFDSAGFAVVQTDGTVTFITKKNTARSTLDVTEGTGGVLEAIPNGNELLVVRDGGVTVIDLLTQEIVGAVEGVGGQVSAVIPSSPEVDALLSAPVYDEVHVLADSAYTVEESAEPDTVEVAIDIATLIDSGDPAEFSFLTTPFAAFEHTVIIHTGFDDIVLAGFGTAGKVRTFVEDGRVKLTAEVLKDGRTGNSSVSLDGGERIYEHPDADPETPAGENNAQTIELGRVEDFLTETGDDDDTVESVDDDDAAVETPGGCGSCEYSNNGSDAVAGLGLMATIAFVAMRNRVRRGIFGK